MSEYQQDPSANTARFKAFVDQAETTERPRTASGNRGLLIGGIVVAVVLIAVILAVTL